MARLALAALAGLPAGVARPAYDPASARVGIVHVGLGAFPRAHQAVYTDDVLGPDPCRSHTPSGFEAVQGLKADSTLGERFRFERLVSELSARYVQSAVVENEMIPWIIAKTMRSETAIIPNVDELPAQ